MAEKFVRRKQKPVWPWLLALLVVIGIIWIMPLITGTDKPEGDPIEGPVEENMETTPADTLTDTVPPKETTNEFAWFIEQSPPAGDTLQVEYLIEGMDYLSATLGVLVDKKFVTNPQVDEKRSTLTAKIDQLKADSAAERLPRHIKEAFVSAADLMALLQEESYPELDGTVSDLKKVAASIDSSTDKNTLKRKVDLFFKESSNITLEMTNSDQGQ